MTAPIHSLPLHRSVSQVFDVASNPRVKADVPRSDTESASEAVQHDQVSISEEARELSRAGGSGSQGRREANPSGTGGVTASRSEELSRQEMLEVQQLAKRDRAVRAHEQAHRAAGGRYAGPAQYTHTIGPDGNSYATGGEVSISISEVSGDPQATIAKMQVIKRAALAPAEPSSQDRAVHAQAARIEQEARAELLQEQAEVSSGGEAAQRGNVEAPL